MSESMVQLLLGFVLKSVAQAAIGAHTEAEISAAACGLLESWGHPIAGAIQIWVVCAATWGHGIIWVKVAAEDHV